VPRIDPAAKRYAEALFAMARDQNALDAWQPHLDDVRTLLLDPTAQAFLRSATPEARKFAVIDEALPEAPAPVRNLAKLLVRKRRVALGPQVAAAFLTMVDTARNVAVATVTTAQPLDDSGRGAVVAAVRRATGATDVRLAEQVDAAILGGAIVQIGDHILDGSVRTRLQGLRRSIAGSIT
jgi:F-type H+-transporting ATPase subunit delta